MKSVFWYSLAGAATLVALVAAVPALVPASIYKAQIENGITRATGRQFAIAGPLHFTLFPAPAIRADRITLAGIAGGHAVSVATADDIQLDVRFWSLLSGRLELTRIVLDKPAIALEVRSDGRANWIFPRSRAAKAGDSGLRFSITPHFSNIEVIQGSVSYANARTGTKYKIEHVDATIGFTGLDQPATATGYFTWASRRVSLRAKVATPEQFLNAREGKLELSLASNASQATFSGAVMPDGHVSGAIKLEITSLRDTAAWLGARIPDSNGFDALSLRSAIDGDNRSITLKNLAATLDEMHVNGDLRVAMDAPLPFAEGTISVDRLDLNPYIEHRHRHTLAHRSSSVEEWSREPIYLDILKKVNASLTLNAGKVTVRKLKLGKTRLRVGLRNGILDTALFPMSLYGGSGNAALVIDADKPVPSFHTELEFNNIALQPFLSDTIGVKQIEGIGAIKLDLMSAGENPQAIVRSMNGKGSITFHDGRLRGVDLGAVGRAVQTLLSTVTKPDSFTAFISMNGSFMVTNGVLTSKDFQLAGSTLKTTGSGSVDIGNRSVDFRIVPQANAIIAKHRFSLGVPFRIKGPWKHVRYTADITGILNSVLDNLETGKAPFKGLFGASKPRDPNAPKKKHKSVGDALKNMFGVR